MTKSKSCETITPADPESSWTYCTNCGRDLVGNHSRHLVTSKAKIEKRLAR